jgi:hypothetical protein
VSLDWIGATKGLGYLGQGLLAKSSIAVELRGGRLTMLAGCQRAGGPRPCRAVSRATRQPANGRSRLSSWRAMERRWTASGPSAMRNARAQL